MCYYDFSHHFRLVPIRQELFSGRWSVDKLHSSYKGYQYNRKKNESIDHNRYKTRERHCRYCSCFLKPLLIIAEALVPPEFVFDRDIFIGKNTMISVNDVAGENLNRLRHIYSRSHRSGQSHLCYVTDAKRRYGRFLHATCNVLPRDITTLPIASPRATFESNPTCFLHPLVWR